MGNSAVFSDHRVYDLRSKLLMIATRELGVTELSLALASDRILDYFYFSSLTNTRYESRIVSDEVPWCAAFVAYVLTTAAIRLSHNTLLAKSFVSAFIANYGPFRSGYISDLSFMDIVILNRGNDPLYGHVGFYLGSDPNKPTEFLLMGGNQGNQVSIKSYPIADVHGCRLLIH